MSNNDNKIYPLEDFEKYLKNPNIISNEFVNNIQNLCKKLYPNFNFNSSEKKEVYNKKTPTNTFPVKTYVTKIIPNVNKNIDLLTGLLNKMATKNYEAIKLKIIDILQGISENHTEMTLASTCIFEIASNNRFYSILYAKLYAELLIQFENLNTTFAHNFDRFLIIFNEIESIEPMQDYNKFCDIGKQNEKRKSMSSFYINLSEHGIIKKDKIIQILTILFNLVLSMLHTEGNNAVIDEIVESIIILYQNTLISSEEYTSIMLSHGKSISDLLEVISHSKPSHFKSLSQKTIFKIMDLLDI